MNILYVSQYFPPEMGAPAARVYELGKEWVRMGHSVTVLTGFPNHPSGMVPPEYAAALRRLTISEQVDGINVVRTWLYPSANKATAGRIANYVSFFASAVCRGICLEPPTIIIGSSPQPLAALAALILARRYGCPFVVEIRDLWPESLPAVGQTTDSSLIYRSVRRLADALYRAADLIVVVSERFSPHIRERVPRAKIAVIENGVNTDLFKPSLDREALKKQLGLEGRYVITYAGTIGMAHGLHTIMEAAHHLSTKYPTITFLLIGDGAELAHLKQSAQRTRATNVTFLAALPRERLVPYLAASDICLVLLRRAKLFETVIPSKMLEFMSCARPIILGVPGLAAQILKTSRSGVAIQPENASQLVQAITGLYHAPQEAQMMGERGRTYITKLFQRQKKAEQYIDALAEAVAKIRATSGHQAARQDQQPH